MPTRYLRFSLADKIHYGILSEDSHSQEVIETSNPFSGDEFRAPQKLTQRHRLSEVKLLSPVNPSKIIGIGLNYVDHAKEQGKPLPEVPLVFVKAVSALTNPGAPIKLNRHCTEVHYEAELAVIIGKKCKNVSEKDAVRYIAGYSIANDVTDRVIQKKELTFARAKGMDTFCPVGPYLVTDIDPKNLSIKLFVNGSIKQNGNTRDMVRSVPKIIQFVSEFMTLYPGDVILTGTPAGVGPIVNGDRVKIEIEHLGVLENAVEHEV